MANEAGKPSGNSNLFSVQIHHGGKWFCRPTIRYEGGSIAWYDYCDPDVMSIMKLAELVEKLGYCGLINYYYIMTGKSFPSGLKMLLTDNDVMEMVQQLPPSRTVEVYIDPINPIGLVQSQQNSSGTPFETDDLFMYDVDPFVDIGVHGGGGVPTKEGTTNVDEPMNEGTTDVNYDEFVVDDEFLNEVDVDQVGDGSSSESDASFFIDSEYEQSDDDDEVMGWEGLGSPKGKEPMFNDDLGDDLNDGDDYGDDSDDDLHSADSHSDDEVKQHQPEYRRETDLGKVQFVPAMKFCSANEFREAVREYSIKAGKDIKFLKNETTRVKAVCARRYDEKDKDKVVCEWSIMGSLSQKGDSFQVKSYKSHHQCLRSFKVRQVTSRYLANRYVDDIRSNPTMPVEHLQERIRKELVVDVSLSVAYRAKRKALDLIQGTNLEQFSRLRDYCEELRRTNPDTTVVMKTIPPPTEVGQPTFERLYICLGALKQGIIAGCRRLVCMDACHLKGTHGGQLLVAVGIDANNQGFPFAYAVVESETKDSWTWFLELVKEDLQIENTGAWTFISDKQKGLVPALLDVVPNAEFRFCTRHLYTNFRDLHKGMELRKQLWEAARSTTVPDFNIAMEKMKSTDVEAYKWLLEKPASQWSRSHFSPTNHCDILVNNLCEGFNKDIKKARDKAIISCLEWVRCYLMKRMTKRREKINLYQHDLCPNIIKKLEKYKEYVGDCNPMWSGEGHFQVHCSNMEQYTINLAEHTCSCRRWQLKGIPCVHAIAAISFKHQDILTYVHPCYKKETNADIYRGIIYPINGWNMWPRSNCVPVLPPNYGRSVGRPRKSRRKERAEVEELMLNPEKMRREKGSLRCGKCGQWGHNIRSCKNEANPDIRRRPSGGYVFTKPSGKPRGRPRLGGNQPVRARGRGVAVATEGHSQEGGTSDVARGRGGGRPGGGGRTRGGRGRSTSSVGVQPSGRLRSGHGGNQQSVAAASVAASTMTGPRPTPTQSSAANQPVSGPQVMLRGGRKVMTRGVARPT